MEENLDAEETRLFELMQYKNWEELTEEEQLFAARHISGEEYNLHREIMLAASEELYPDFEYFEPLPLAIEPVRKPKPFIRRSIPLYQAFAAFAAVIIFFIVTRPGSPADVPVLPEKPETATVQAVAEKQHIYDTVVKYVTVVSESHKTTIDTIRRAVAFPLAEDQPRLLQAANVPMPELTSEKLETRGASLKEENTSRLVPKIVNTIY